MPQKISTLMNYIQKSIFTLSCAGLIYIAATVQSTHDDMILVKDTVDRLSENQFSQKDFLVSVSPYEKRITKNSVDIASISKDIEKIKEDLYVKYPNPRRRVH